jgi:hypothetical protein
VFEGYSKNTETEGPVACTSRKEWKMKKLTFAMSAASVLAAATIGLAAPATAAPSAPFPTDCSVHVIYQGNPVDVNWC